VEALLSTSSDDAEEEEEEEENRFMLMCDLCDSCTPLLIFGNKERRNVWSERTSLPNFTFFIKKKERKERKKVVYFKVNKQNNVFSFR
jgi:hypothetical protein